jgi:predicted transcriptional regulator
MEKPDLYVVARFIEVLLKKGRMKKTNLQMSVGLNYSAFLKYLDWFQQHQLAQAVADEDGNELVTLTPRGLEAYDKLVGWIKQTLGNLAI